MSDTLERIAARVADARSLELQQADLTERLKQIDVQLNNIYRIELPDLMNEAKVDRVDIPPNGNEPGFSAELQPYYKALIAASWPVERRTAALDALVDCGAADLIKTEITINVPREERKRVATLLKAIQGVKIKQLEIETKEMVAHNTLTKWLKERYEKGLDLPALDLIGAVIGEIVKLKPIKDK